jgi:hypothetical protein
MEKVFGLEIPENLEDACELNRTALLVYDMQVGIFSQLSNGDEIKSRVVEVLQTARAVGLRIFFMRHMSLPNELSGIFQLKTAKAWQRATSVKDVNPWFLRDTPGFQRPPPASPKHDIADCLKILDGGLERRSFLLSEYSLVDTHLQGIVGWMGMMDVDLKPFANVTGWLQRCYERPAIAKLMAG